MSSLTYIIGMSIKNRLLEVIRKPVKLILYLLVIAGMAGIMIISLSARTEAKEFLPMFWLKGIVFALILLFFLIAIAKGLKSGDVIFDMSDVNFLFVSPLKPQSILLYGVFRMMGMSLLAGFFILFQGSSLGVWFGVNFWGLLLILGGFTLAVSFMQIVSLIIYSLTNGKPKRKMFVKIMVLIMFLPMIAVAVWQVYRSNGDFMMTLENLLRSPVMSWTPVVGWTAEGTVAFISGDILTGVLFFGIIITAGAVLVLYIMKSNPDYYEDALVATETAFERKRAIAEGQINTEALSDKKVKLTATGISGIGSSAVFHKHLRESFRANRFGLWGVMSVITVLISVIIAVIWRMTNETDTGSLIILQALMWSQLFAISMGRGLKELYSHYIYMIPEPSFKKIVWSNLEVVFKVFAEGVLAFGIAGIILGEPLPLVIAVIVVYTLFALLLIGINYLSLRWTGADMSAGILVLIYVIAVILIMLPGLVSALIVGSLIKTWGVLAGLFVLAAWELLVAAVCFALSKGILDKCDMPTVKMGK